MKKREGTNMTMRTVSTSIHQQQSTIPKTNNFKCSSGEHDTLPNTTMADNDAAIDLSRLIIEPKGIQDDTKTTATTMRGKCCQSEQCVIPSLRRHANKLDVFMSSALRKHSILLALFSSFKTINNAASQTLDNMWQVCGVQT